MSKTRTSAFFYILRGFGCKGKEKCSFAAVSQWAGCRFDVNYRLAGPVYCRTGAI